jgi:hypothetical protein
MKTIPFIRLASYAICVVVFLLRDGRRSVIPVDLVGEEFSQRLMDRDRAARLSAAIIQQKDFRYTRLSGREVIALAESTARQSGDDLTDYGEPQISLTEEDGRVVWSVSFHHIPLFPGGFFTVAVDDQTRATKIYPGM